MTHQEPFEGAVEALNISLSYQPVERLWRASICLRRQFRTWGEDPKETRYFADAEDAYDWVSRRAGTHLFA